MGETPGGAGILGQHPERDAPTMFLDFDGVLHRLGEPAIDENFRPLDNPGLFCWLPLLQKALAPYPEIRIVIASDWRRIFDDATLVGLLGDAFECRVIGSVESFCRSRAEEISMEAARRGLRRWLAIDDHPSVWAAREAGDSRFIACLPDFGLSETRVQRELRQRLEALVRGQ